MPSSCNHGMDFCTGSLIFEIKRELLPPWFAHFDILTSSPGITAPAFIGIEMHKIADGVVIGNGAHHIYAAGRFDH